MESIIVGDLHGDLQLYHQIKAKFAGEHLILVGDYLDSFVYTRTEQRALMELVLDDIEAGLVEGLLGNHELSYLYPDMKCAGYSRKFSDLLLPLKSRMHHLLKPFIWDEENKTLISHAGLTKQWYNSYYMSLEEEDQCTLEEFLLDSFRRRDSICDAGWRVGSQDIPGLFWCDYFAEFKAIENIRQIFGHTPVQAIKERSNNTWPIDCLQEKQQVLRLTNNNKPEIIDL